MKLKFVEGEKAIVSMPITVKSIDKVNFTLTMVASTQEPDRHNDVIIQSGWDTKNFLKNPAILNSHRYDDVTEIIAKATRTEIIGKGKRSRLEQDWKFAVNENPKAKIIFDLYANGFARASSVGFIPKKFKQNQDGTTDWFTIEEAELLEVSAVSVPANALALAKAKGIDVDTLINKRNDNGEEDDNTAGDDDEVSEDTEISPADGQSPSENGDDSESGQETGDEEAGQAGEDDEDNDDVPDEEAPEVDDKSVMIKCESCKKDIGLCDPEIKALFTKAQCNDCKTAEQSKPRYDRKKAIAEAIKRIDHKERKYIGKAAQIINGLLDNDKEGQELDKKVRSQIRKRKVNQAIRILMKSK